MSTYFAQLLAVKLKQNKKSFKMAMLALLLFPSAQLMAETQNKAVWYRYYDQKGVANISSNVTPNHIRYGYEALDRNMQVIQRARPYNTETDIKKAPQRAAQARQSESDQRLKKAYTNSQTATIKRNNALTHIKKQISFQQEQLKQLQTDRISFKRKEMEYLRKVKPVPPQLKTNLDNNLKNIELKKDMIQSLQTSYRNTQAEYDRIIQRLRVLE